MSSLLLSYLIFSVLLLLVVSVLLCLLLIWYVVFFGGGWYLSLGIASPVHRTLSSSSFLHLILLTPAFSILYSVSFTHFIRVLLLFLFCSHLHYPWSCAHFSLVCCQKLLVWAAFHTQTFYSCLHWFFVVAAIFHCFCDSPF